MTGQVQREPELGSGGSANRGSIGPAAVSAGKRAVPPREKRAPHWASTRLENSKPPKGVAKWKLRHVWMSQSINRWTCSGKCKHVLIGLGDCDAEKAKLEGESAPEDEESSETGIACGSKRGTEGVCSGLSSSLTRASSWAMVSRRSWVRVLPLPSSYSHRSCFLARTHC